VKKALEALPIVSAMLDGEVVVETERGHAGLRRAAGGPERSRSDRFHYYVFDLLHLDGVDLTGATLLDRKQCSRSFLSGHEGGLKYSEHVQRTRRHDARRMPAAWVLRARLQAQGRPLSPRPLQGVAQNEVVEGSEFVIIGYVPSTTQRRAIGALVLGYYRKDKLEYAGRVGSGSRAGWPRTFGAAWSRSGSTAATRKGAARRCSPQCAMDQNPRWSPMSKSAAGPRQHRPPSGLQGLRQDKPAADVVRSDQP